MLRRVFPDHLITYLMKPVWYVRYPPSAGAAVRASRWRWRR